MTAIWTVQCRRCEFLSLLFLKFLFLPNLCISQDICYLRDERWKWLHDHIWDSLRNDDDYYSTSKNSHVVHIMKRFFFWSFLVIFWSFGREKMSSVICTWQISCSTHKLPLFVRSLSNCGITNNYSFYSFKSVLLTISINSAQSFVRFDVPGAFSFAVSTPRSLCLYGFLLIKKC